MLASQPAAKDSLFPQCALAKTFVKDNYNVSVTPNCCKRSSTVTAPFLGFFLSPYRPGHLRAVPLRRLQGGAAEHRLPAGRGCGPALQGRGYGVWRGRSGLPCVSTRRPGGGTGGAKRPGCPPSASPVASREVLLAAACGGPDGEAAWPPASGTDPPPQAHPCPGRPGPAASFVHGPHRQILTGSEGAPAVDAEEACQQCSPVPSARHPLGTSSGATGPGACSWGPSW